MTESRGEMRMTRRRLSNPKGLESRFLLMWRACKGPELEREFVFHPTRKWRVDFCHRASRTLIEVEGLGGRHQQVRGFIDDCEKYLEASLLGYRVVRLTVEQVRIPVVERIVKFLEGAR